ncbi:MAG: prepilin-type N-terminal cleavage/methylation domain-containing protein [Planctomycetota bacterium]|jgi:prepilin-type N-terminal cleavage/methylation domain-containing protein
MVDRRGGFTLVEVMIAVAVLAAAALGIISAYATSERASRMVAQEAAVENVLRERMAEVRADAQDDLGAVIAELTTNAAAGEFDVPSVGVGGLTPVDGATSVGQVFLHLNESTVPPQFGGGGGGIDLDGSGVVGDADLVGSPETVRLLPIEVRAAWRSPAGDAVRRRFLLVARR